ncbi:transposase [Deferrisoma camini]|uniref:transposase n=1 Tax=Deferrisoma camini TaxID=1035120 RepID=UPI00247FB3CF|nr:transposase [Deferrisoma camini]
MSAPPTIRTNRIPGRPSPRAAAPQHPAPPPPQRLAGAKTLKLVDVPASSPGVGPVVAAMVLAAIGDPHRFQHRRQVLRLAGLDLCASRSGKTSDRAVPKISKQGKGALRYALVHAAIIAAHQNPAIRAYFTRCLEGRQHERGIRQKMYVKLAAKLLVVAWHLMKTRSVFDPERFLAGQTG